MYGITTEDDPSVVMELCAGPSGKALFTRVMIKGTVERLLSNCYTGLSRCRVLLRKPIVSDGEISVASDVSFHLSDTGNAKYSKWRWNIMRS